MLPQEPVGGVFMTENENLAVTNWAANPTGLSPQSETSHSKFVLKPKSSSAWLSSMTLWSTIQRLKVQWFSLGGQAGFARVSEEQQRGQVVPQQQRWAPV